MRNLHTGVLLPSFFILALAGNAAAQQQLPLDSAHSALKFHAKNTFDEFSGMATQVTGSLTMNGDKPSSGQVQFPSANLKTGVDGRDRNMDEPRFLDIVNFPVVSFTFDSLDGPPVSQTAASSGKVHGSLKVKTVSLPVVANVTYIRSGNQIRVTGDFPLDIRKLAMDPPVVALVQRMDATIQVSFTLVFAGSGG